MKKHKRPTPEQGYRVRGALDQPTLDRLYGLKRRLERGKISKHNNKETSNYGKEKQST